MKGGKRRAANEDDVDFSHLPPETAAAMRRRIEERRDPGECQVWPENVEAVQLFLDVQTQWRVGFGGATGLDYAAVETVMRIRRIPRGDRPDLLDRLQVLERETLRLWAEA